MQGKQQNITIESGADFVYRFQVYDDNGDPANLAGMLVEAQLREFAEAADCMMFSVVYDNTGKITLTLPHEFTSQLPYYSGVYACFVQDQQGNRWRVRWGSVTIEPNVVRPVEGTVLHIIGVDELDDLPATGLIDRLYLCYKDQTVYRWNGTNYVSALVEMTVAGEHDSTREYLRLTIVSANGMSYVSKSYVPSGVDVENETYWMPLMSGSAAEEAHEAALEAIAAAEDATAAAEEARSMIDDTAGDGDTDKVWSADKLTSEFYKQELKEGNVLYFFPSLQTGQYGNSCLVVTPTRTILFDCHPLANWELEKDWLDGLLADGIFSNIDYVIISHYHYDHCGNFRNIMGRYPHEGVKVYIPMGAASYKPTSSPAKDNWNYGSEYYSGVNSIPNYCSSNNIDCTEVTTDMLLTISEDEDIDITLWNSTADDYNYYKAQTDVAYNDYSMVAVFRHGKIKSLFLGDLQRRGQMRVLSQHPVPKVWMWSWNHHLAQNDDYIPFYNTISPDYSVVQYGAYQAATLVDDEYVYTPINDAGTRYARLYFKTDHTSLAYSDCVLVSSKNGGKKISGKTMQRNVFSGRTCSIYVDNSYSGDLCDGSEDHPFKEIGDAIISLPNDSDSVVYVQATDNPYAGFRIHNQTQYLKIQGVEDGLGNLPIVNNVDMRYGSATVLLSKLKFSTASNVKNGTVYCQVCAREGELLRLENCIFDGTARAQSETFSNVSAVCAYRCKMVISGCTFINYFICFRSYDYGALYLSNDVCTVTDCTYFIFVGNLDLEMKCTSVTINGDNRTAKLFYASSARNRISFITGFDFTLLSNMSDQTYTSLPFYYSATYPVAIASGAHVYDVLTGTVIV